MGSGGLHNKPDRLHWNSLETCQVCDEYQGLLRLPTEIEIDRNLDHGFLRHSVRLTGDKCPGPCKVNGGTVQILAGMTYDLNSLDSSEKIDRKF